jgi:hypothetical protein
VALVLAVALREAWRSAATMNPDGVAYLDLSDRLLAGDWHHFISLYWSPFLPALLALARFVLGTGPEHEFEIAHAVMFVAAAAACAAWVVLLCACDRSFAAAAPERAALFGRRDIRLALHAAFAWTVLWLCPPEFVTPDLFLVAAILASAALLLRASQTGRGTFALGIALGGAYLIKFIALPLMVAFVAVLAFGPGSGTARARRAALALLGFATLALPWIATLTVTSGHLTAGDTGRLNYSWFVLEHGRIAPEAARSAEPAAMKQLLDKPPVFAFGDSSFGTLPAWADPVHWSTDVSSALDVRALLRAGRRELRTTVEILSPILFTVGLAGLILIGRRDSPNPLLPLGIIAATGMALYSFVHVEGRLIAPFVPLGACALLAHIAGTAELTRWRALLVQVSAGVLVTIATILIMGVELLLWVERRPSLDQFAVPAAVANAVATRAEPGRHIAVIGQASDMVALARRARLKLIAEIPPRNVDAYWNSSGDQRECALAAMYDAGVRAVIAVSPYPDEPGPGWERLFPGTAVLSLPQRPACAGGGPP